MTEAVDTDLQSGALIEVLAELAEAAAAVILPFWRAGVVAERKGDDSPVTQADRAAETLILERLFQLYPGISAVAEEDAAAHGVPDQAADQFWLIDPLDGTRGFVEGREAYTVNIALIRDRRPVAGVVTAPATSITWAGSVEQGARRRRFGEPWTPIRVRARPKFAQALVSHSISPADAETLAGRYGCVEWRGEDSSLKFCRIAEGDFDAYPRTGPTSEWDTAAGHAVLEAAGGRVLDGDGQPLLYGKPCFKNGPFLAVGG